MQDDILGWSLWNEKFSALDGHLSVAELHGLMMGVLCITQVPDVEAWRQILALLKIPSLPDDAIEFLTEEAEDASYALAESELDYLPILPDDEHHLNERVEALADWCSGVVLGFGLVAQQLSDDEAEQIEILQNIASVEFDDSDNDEEGEVAYEELYEHARLIPIHLAIGRPNKLTLAESGILNTAKNTSSSQVNHTDVVEMFNPQQFS